MIVPSWAATSLVPSRHAAAVPARSIMCDGKGREWFESNLGRTGPTISLQRYSYIDRITGMMELQTKVVLITHGLIFDNHFVFYRDAGKEHGSIVCR